MTFKVEELALMTGSSIQIADPLVRIHQPKLEEIAFIGGEEKLFQSMNIFFIDSEPLEQYIETLEVTQEEKEDLKNTITSYDTLLFVLQAYSGFDYEDNYRELVEMIETVFELMIPTHEFIHDVEDGVMTLISDEKSNSIVVDRDFFAVIEDIAKQIFLLDVLFDRQEDSEMSEAAKRIAEKMAAAEKKIQGENDEEASSQFALMLSILGIRHQLDYLSSLTIYQIYNQFERFNLHTQYDQAMRSALAGASDVELVNWYKKI